MEFVKKLAAFIYGRLEHNKKGCFTNNTTVRQDLKILYPMQDITAKQIIGFSKVCVGLPIPHLTQIRQMLFTLASITLPTLVSRYILISYALHLCYWLLTFSYPLSFQRKHIHKYPYLLYLAFQHISAGTNYAIFTEVLKSLI